ncbi:MAG: sensor domain-containing diguanylate cyclase [Deltaproteobacteria bacterium]|nr:sensor domain-containing diguanylate cyclase [Deltaproteobacteria bacterium]
MNDIEEIIERVKRNEKIERKFFEVEVRILSILNFKDLFENLLTEIRKTFDIPYVWLSLIQENNVAHLIRQLGTSGMLDNKLNIIEPGTFRSLVGNGTRPVLVNGDLTPYYKLFPDHEKYLIRSLALIPLRQETDVIGSLNCGDSAPERYHPGMDVSLLERLSVILSICISNVAAHEKIRLAASSDPLTGLINRRVMERILKREFSRALRYEMPLAVAFLDLDDFKSLNDRYGHDFGDIVLKYVGNQLVRMSRDSDIVTRFAGDEFVIILPGNKRDDTYQMMNRLNRYLSKNPPVHDGEKVRISVSFGVAHIQDAGVQDPASLLKRADERLYEAKRKKKKSERVVSFDRS